MIPTDGSIEGVLARGRDEVHRAMVATLVVREPPTLSPANDDGDVFEVPGAVIYGPDVLPHRGVGRIKAPAAVYEREVESGGHQLVELRASLHFPWDAPRILEDHRVECVGDRWTPQNVGRRFRVAAPGAQTLGTAQRVPADELVGRAMPNG